MSSVARMRSDLNSGSGEVSKLGEEDEDSGGESDLVQTESNVARQLKPPAETEEVTVLFLGLCLEDFLGGSGKRLPEGFGEEVGISSLVK